MSPAESVEEEEDHGTRDASATPESEEEQQNNNMNRRNSKTIITQNTNYAGVARIHHETDPALAKTNNNMLNKMDSQMQAYQTIYKKELTKIDHNKKALEKSMLAYSERMKEISLRRGEPFVDFSLRPKRSLHLPIVNRLSLNSNKHLSKKPPLDRIKLRPRRNDGQVLNYEGEHDQNNDSSGVSSERNNFRKYRTRKYVQAADKVSRRRVEFVPSSGMKRKLAHIFNDSKCRASTTSDLSTSSRDANESSDEADDKKPTVIFLRSDLKSRDLRRHKASSSSGKDQLENSQYSQKYLSDSGYDSLTPSESFTRSNSNETCDSFLKISPFPNIPSEAQARIELGLMSENDRTLLVPRLENKLKLRRKLHEQKDTPLKKHSPQRKEKSPSKLPDAQSSTRRKTSLHATERSPTKEGSVKRQHREEKPKQNPNLVVHHFFSYSDALHSSFTEKLTPPGVIETRRDSVNTNILHATKRGIFELPQFKYEDVDGLALPPNVSARRQPSTMATILAGPFTPDMQISDITSPEKLTVDDSVQRRLSSGALPEIDDAKSDEPKRTLKHDNSPHLPNTSTQKTVHFDLPNVETSSA